MMPGKRTLDREPSIELEQGLMDTIAYSDELLNKPEQVQVRQQGVGARHAT
jgi:hypothetical protein